MSTQREFLETLIRVLRTKRFGKPYQLPFEDYNLKIYQDFLKRFELLVSSGILADFFKEVIEDQIIVSKLFYNLESWEDNIQSELILDSKFLNEPDVKTVHHVPFDSIDFDDSDLTFGSAVEDLVFYTLIEIVSELYRNEKTRPKEKLTEFLFKKGQLCKYIKNLDLQMLFNLNPILKDSIFFKSFRSKAQELVIYKPGTRRPKLTTLGRKEAKNKSNDVALLRRLQILLCCFDPENEGYARYELLLEIGSEKFGISNYGNNMQRKMLKIRSAFNLKSSMP